MPRRRRFPTTRAARQNEAAAASVISLVTLKGPRVKRTKPGPKALKRLREETAEMRATENWDNAAAGHLVALYEWCHEQVYGVAPAELLGVEWWAATSAATKMVRDEFAVSEPPGVDITEAVEFVRWSWREEKRREEWRRTNGQEGGRMGWRQQFLRKSLITDYRIQQKRLAP